MNYNKTTEAIKNELTAIEQLINSFKLEKSNLEIDLALSKMRHLYDLMLMLKGEIVNPYTEEKIKEITPPIKNVEKPTVEQPKKEIKEEPSIEQLAKEAVTYASDEKEETNIDERPKLIAEKLKPTKPSIGENLAQQNHKTDVASKIQSKPIKNLASAIGINDRFLFQRELFKTNKELYLETIQAIDGAATLDEAMAIISPFNWDEENDTFIKFVDLIKRRF